MKEIIYFDRVDQTRKKERVYGQFFLSMLYGDRWWNRLLSFFVLPLIVHTSILSRLYGYLQKSSLSRYKVRSFIQQFGVDSSEFLEPVASFRSFNDFFIRKLDLKRRPIVQGDDLLILPADARYLVFPLIQEMDSFWIKKKKFSIAQLVRDSGLAARYQRGSMVIARLCPVDYHRFHFPCDCTPSAARELAGPLFSVNPIALRRYADILTENKRMITSLTTNRFGTILYIEVGATYVGTIHQTYTAQTRYHKGEEKGYFSFGGSCLILLFEPGVIQFEEDLLHYSSQTIEVRGLLGQPLGRSLT